VEREDDGAVRVEVCEKGLGEGVCDCSLHFLCPPTIPHSELAYANLRVVHKERPEELTYLLVPSSSYPPH
jgi:hypothetical protein